MPKHLQIAIDGPAGSGKSTVAKGVAEALGFTFVDTGAMYRCVALAMLRAGLGVEQEDAVGELARGLDIGFGELHDGQQRVFLNGEDVTAEIRSPEVHGCVSPVSAIQPVRDALLTQQRELAAAGPVVMEGRDIQTVVLPGAQVKVFLDASVAERARRRFAEMPEGSSTLAEVEKNIVDRDARDSSRRNAPLKAAAEANVIDTDPLTVDQVIAIILDLAARAGAPGRAE